jgi:hypothetical protein
MLASMDRRIQTLGLELTGVNVVTEAATGAYACTAVIAALAGARVRATARSTRRHGTAADAVAATLKLARLAGVESKIDFIDRIEPSALADCDILTNSGHIRPITGEMVRMLPERAVIALMFEAWEHREADLDLAASRARGIRVACVNERHPDVAVFPFLGPLCVRLMADAGIAAGGQRVALICDNPFEPYLMSGLVEAGATVSSYRCVHSVPVGDWDVIVLAVIPSRNRPTGPEALAHLARIGRRAPVVQFWGDVDRAAAQSAGLTVAPAQEPAAGHMGILLNALGFEPIVRLQCGGLKAAEVVFRGAPLVEGQVAELL